MVTDFYKKVYVNPKLAQFGQFNDTPVGAVAGRIEENKETKLLTQVGTSAKYPRGRAYGSYPG